VVATTMSPMRHLSGKVLESPRPIGYVVATAARRGPSLNVLEFTCRRPPVKSHGIVPVWTCSLPPGLSHGIVPVSAGTRAPGMSHGIVPVSTGIRAAGISHETATGGLTAWIEQSELSDLASHKV
jgi:hypothetical protein